jgi:hypothetical protein
VAAAALKPSFLLRGFLNPEKGSPPAVREKSKNDSAQCLSVGSVAGRRGFFGTISAPSPALSSSVLGFGLGKFSFPPLLSEERLGQDSGPVFIN